MARRREQEGQWVKSKSTWTIQYRKYGLNNDWKWAFHFVGLKATMGIRVADRERKAFMAGVNVENHRPASLMTLADFWSRFEAQVVWKKKPSGQKHYAYCWRVLEPLAGQWPLAEVAPEHIEDVVRLLFERGYAGQSVLHFKNCLSAMFRHAKKLRMYRDENPASLVDLPEIRHERRPTYTPAQLGIVLRHLSSPEREMAQLSVMTSMGPAEMCGVTLRWCNLTGALKVADGVVLAPFSIAVKENVYEGKRGSLKASSRERIEPITPELAAELQALVMRSPRQDDAAPLFQSSKGTPKDAHNISNRVFKPLAKVVGFSVTWYAFRRAHSSLAGQIQGVSLEDRRLTMGHADGRMSLYYAVEDVERRRAIPSGIQAVIDGAGGTVGSVQ